MSMHETGILLDEISAQIYAAIPTWAGDEPVVIAHPEITTRPWSFMLRYPLQKGGAVLLKVARHQEMSIEQSVSEKTLLERTEREFEMLSQIAEVFRSHNGAASADFCFVRPLEIFPRWNALAMEELESEPLKAYLLKPQMMLTISKDWERFEELLTQSARWLRTYHQGMGNRESVALAETKLAVRIDHVFKNLKGHVSSAKIDALMDAVQKKYSALAAHEVDLAMIHGDFHCGNILVTTDGRVGALDADLTQSPAYQDLAKFYADLETRGIQVLLRGNFLQTEKLKRAYRAITKGYFTETEFDEEVFQLFILVAIIEKWLMDEIAMQQASGITALGRRVFAGWRRAYFVKLLQEKLA